MCHIKLTTTTEPSAGMKGNKQVVKAESWPGELVCVEVHKLSQHSVLLINILRSRATLEINPTLFIHVQILITFTQFNSDQGGGGGGGGDNAVQTNEKLWHTTRLRCFVAAQHAHPPGIDWSRRGWREDEIRGGCLHAQTIVNEIFVAFCILNDMWDYRKPHRKPWQWFFMTNKNLFRLNKQLSIIIRNQRPLSKSVIYVLFRRRLTFRLRLRPAHCRDARVCLDKVSLGEVRLIINGLHPKMSHSKKNKHLQQKCDELRKHFKTRLVCQMSSLSKRTNKWQSNVASCDHLTTGQPSLQLLLACRLTDATASKQTLVWSQWELLNGNGWRACRVSEAPLFSDHSRGRGLANTFTIRR